MVHVFSLGGSIVAPDGVDVPFVESFLDVVRAHLAEVPGDRLVLVIGGGGAARAYQKALRELNSSASADHFDWVGIAATRLNAELVRGALGDLAPDPVVTDPTAELSLSGRVLVGSGWKPGFSTDYDAVCLAERLGAPRICNLSNIAQVYDSDPAQNPDARPIERATWSKFRRIVGDDWIPGANTPFDPVASERAEALGLEVAVANGRNLENVRALLKDEPFTGTRIVPDR